MSEIITLKDHPDLLNVVRAVSPKYRKHKAILSEASSYTNHGSYWDGGSRSSAWMVDPHHHVTAVRGPTAPSPFSGSGKPNTIDIPAGHYVVVVGTFRGKTATAQIIRGK